MCTEAIGEVVHSLYQQPHHSDVLLRRLKLNVGAHAMAVTKCAIIGSVAIYPSCECMSLCHCMCVQCAWVCSVCVGT